MKYNNIFLRIPIRGTAAAGFTGFIDNYMYYFDKL